MDRFSDSAFWRGQAIRHPEQVRQDAAVKSKGEGDDSVTEDDAAGQPNSDDAGTGPVAANKASAKAHSASAAAFESGSPADHVKAANLHSTASNLQKLTDSKGPADHHDAMADCHLAEAKK